MENGYWYRPQIRKSLRAKIRLLADECGTETRIWLSDKIEEILKEPMEKKISCPQ
jgi:hypothetical protein